MHTITQAIKQFEIDVSKDEKKFNTFLFFSYVFFLSGLIILIYIISSLVR